MGVWAQSSGQLIFGARLTGETMDLLVSKLASDVKGAHLQSPRDWDDGDDNEEWEKSTISLDDLTIRANFWLKMHRMQRALVTVAAGVLDPCSPLRFLAGEAGLLQMIFRSLMPVKAPTFESLIVVAAAEEDLGQQPGQPSPRDLAIGRALRAYGVEASQQPYYGAWESQLRMTHYTHHHDLEFMYATTFEGYRQEFPFYILCVTGEQDKPMFGGSKKLSFEDGHASGVDYCQPIGVFSAPAGGAEKIQAAVDDLRAAGMFPAELTDEKKAEIRSQGLIMMPNVPHVGEVGWNVIGHSHVG